jgi:hypothetical protein
MSTLKNTGKFKGGLPAAAHAHEASGGRATGTGREPLPTAQARRVMAAKAARPMTGTVSQAELAAATASGHRIREGQVARTAGDPRPYDKLPAAGPAGDKAAKASAKPGWQPPEMTGRQHAEQVLIHSERAERHVAAPPMRRAFEAMARGHAEKAASVGHGAVETGEKGGMYYTSPSGHRVYLGGNK